MIHAQSGSVGEPSFSGGGAAVDACREIDGFTDEVVTDQIDISGGCAGTKLEARPVFDVQSCGDQLHAGVQCLRGGIEQHHEAVAQVSDQSSAIGLHNGLCVGLVDLDELPQQLMVCLRDILGVVSEVGEDDGLGGQGHDGSAGNQMRRWA